MKRDTIYFCNVSAKIWNTPKLHSAQTLYLSPFPGVVIAANTHYTVKLLLQFSNSAHGNYIKHCASVRLITRIDGHSKCWDELKALEAESGISPSWCLDTYHEVPRSSRYLTITNGAPFPKLCPRAHTLLTCLLDLPKFTSSHDSAHRLGSSSGAPLQHRLNFPSVISYRKDVVGRHRRRSNCSWKMAIVGLRLPGDAYSIAKSDSRIIGTG